MDGEQAAVWAGAGAPWGGALESGCACLLGVMILLVVVVVVVDLASAGSPFFLLLVVVSGGEMGRCLVGGRMEVEVPRL